MAASDKEDHRHADTCIDLGKTTFHLVALGTPGKVLVRKKFNRKQCPLAFMRRTRQCFQHFYRASTTRYRDPATFVGSDPIAGTMPAGRR